MGQGQDRALRVRCSPVMAPQGLREAAGPRASQEMEPVGAGQGGTTPRKGTPGKVLLKSSSQGKGRRERSGLCF